MPPRTEKLLFVASESLTARLRCHDKQTLGRLASYSINNCIIDGGDLGYSLSVCLSVSLCVSVYRSVFIFACLSVYLSSYVSIYFVCLPICMSICVCVCLSVCLPVCINLPVLNSCQPSLSVFWPAYLYVD